MSVKRLNVARIIIQSKINSIPRYLSGLNVITKKSCERVEENISGTVKKLMGWDFCLSKAVMFGDRTVGGLGLTSPVDLYYIEPLANLIRFVNSSAQITREIARKAVIKCEEGKEVDAFWQENLNTMMEQYWYWNYPITIENDEWVIVDGNNKPVKIREKLQQNLRARKIKVGNFRYG